MAASSTTRHHCYILYNERDAYTYVGYTVDPARRLRQHNGELVGGARATTRRSKQPKATSVPVAGSEPRQQFWKFLAIVWSDDAAFTKHKALSMEWWLKHPTGHRKCPGEYRGKDGRLRAVQAVLANPRFQGMPCTVLTRDQCIAYVAERPWKDRNDGLMEEEEDGDGDGDGEEEPTPPAAAAHG